MTKVSLEDLQKYPSMSGKFHKREDAKGLTPLEKSVAIAQGLIAEDGLFKEEALVPKRPESKIPEHLTPPTPIEDLVSDADSLIAEINNIKGENKPAAVIKDDNKVGDGLVPPDMSENVEIKDGPGLPPGEQQKASLHLQIKNAKDPVTCPHCSFDIRQSFSEPEITEDVKARFLRHILSTKGRFNSEVELFGGRIKIIFRSRTQSENDAIQKAIIIASNEKRIQTDVELGLLWNRWRAAASIAEIRTDEPTHIPTLDELLADEHDLMKAIDKLDDAVFGRGKSVALFNAIFAPWTEFEKLYSWLSYKAQDANFWKAADGVH